jgi:hypothetical protein
MNNSIELLQIAHCDAHHTWFDCTDYSTFSTTVLLAIGVPTVAGGMPFLEFILQLLSTFLHRFNYICRFQSFPGVTLRHSHIKN